MKKLLTFFAVLMVVLVIVLMIFMYVEEIAAVKYGIAFFLENSFQSEVTEPSNFEELYSSYPAFVHSNDAWYQNAGLIYHACGGIDGLSYTNSKEAIQLAIQHGNVIEVDFLYTKDNHLVCAHTWSDITSSDDPLTLSEFNSLKIYGKYTPMTAEDLIDFMLQHDNLYIVVDTKESDAVQVVQELIRIGKNHADIAKRFIIQLYTKGTKQFFLDLYPFPNENFLFSCYKYGTNYKDVLSICMEENIAIVTVPYATWDIDVIDLFSEKGIIIYEHTVNRPDQAQQSKEKGIFGFYTDFLTMP